jgi:hypothetical protein
VRALVTPVVAADDRCQLGALLGGQVAFRQRTGTCSPSSSIV